MGAAFDCKRWVQRGTGEAARRSMAASVLVVVMLCSGAISQESSTEYTFRSKTELVLVNVTVRDKNGNPVRDLSARTLPFSKITSRSR